MNKISKYTMVLLGMASLVTSCSTGSDKWHLEGSISGLGENDKVVVEANNQGYWYPVDTLKVGKDGNFKYAGNVQGYPDIFRLRLGESSVYFPVDSIETVTVSAVAPDISGNHSISGSPQALSMQRVDSLIAVSYAAHGASGVGTDENLKRQLGDMIVSDPSGVVSYYIISKRIGNKPLFNPSAPLDLRLIGAVANAYSTMRPDDPRTKYITNLYLANRPRTDYRSDESVQATLIHAFEIELFDRTGKKRSLLELTESGKPVILSFTAYAADWSPAYNLELNKVYEKYRSQGLEIYQVSVDTDEYTWKQSARNLPWITVLNNLSDGARVLRQYNVGSIPTTFVFNRNGELAERVLDIADLDSAVARCL